MSDILKVALSIKDIKRTEMPLPIARKQAIVSSFLLGDHTSLKTALLNPQNYDREMIKCLHKHTRFIEILEDAVTKELDLSYDELTSKVSNIDKICLIYACYNSTYKDLGTREIICEKCKEKLKYKILLEDILKDDSLTIWEESDLPFYEYVYKISVPYDDYLYEFDTCIPTIQRYNQILGMIPEDKIKENLETNAILAQSEELAVVCKSLTIKNSKTQDTLSSTNSMIDILTVFDAAIPYDVSLELRREYDKRFDKYYPKFYTFLNCTCGHDNKYVVDIETEFFRRTLFGREQI